ncbi:cytochrome c oxidase accessory protein CcoG [Telmatospirillum sp.]|uniref:cytochrome c oxidase accessory protein CcoG n=1 Tax=Telmatospirillum sp. TaxID=2079197 RepID=UPI00284568D6|nr:cytochrome c oxidase accessory protein CcoG [Telmatospirillum sp.]MDR3435228.1 cytochrome c oxidase accessory protein CcoG [Telmatospirillum sp.]
MQRFPCILVDIKDGNTGTFLVIGQGQQQDTRRIMPSANDVVVERTPTEPRNVSLYASHVKAYPRFLNNGFFRRLKWAVMAVLLALYWGTPWIRWDRGIGAPDQAVLIDMPGRRAYFFAIEIWPQEVYYLTGLLIIAALSLFFISALLGRVWCGFTCFQTVWTDIFVWIERFFEGERNRRMQLDKEPWSANKLLRKAGKQTCWIVVSVLTGFGFVLFFDNAPTLAHQIVTGQASVNAYGIMAFLTATTYVLAGFAREQVCIYMCPYSRFQSAMFDEHSLVVSYEAWRGEPRGKLKGAVHGRDAADVFSGRGHCVDCKMCVQVCPTGIDIRNGSQLACIGCALCVDACNSVMDRMGLPRGLISYDSSFNQLARAKGETSPRRQLWRPRTFIYLAVIGIVVAVMTYALSTRKTFDLNVLHERSPVFVELSGDRIRNGYTVKILNMVRDNGHFRLSLEGLPEATMTVIGKDLPEAKTVDLAGDSDSVGTFKLFVTAPRASLKGKKVDLTLVLTNLDTGRIIRHENLFAGPDPE